MVSVTGTGVGVGVGVGVAVGVGVGVAVGVGVGVGVAVGVAVGVGVGVAVGVAVGVGVGVGSGPTSPILTTNASSWFCSPPPLFTCNGLLVGKFADAVSPVTKTSLPLQAIPRPSSIKFPPRNVE
jgi:hypothetical protein